MKKIFLMTCLFLWLFMFPISAEDALLLTVTGNTEAEIGEEVVFSVSFDEETEIESMAMIPRFDENIFSLVSGRWLISADLSDFSVAEGNGVLAVSESQTFGGAVLEFTLIAKKETQSTSVSCECVVIDSRGVQKKGTVLPTVLSVSIGSEITSQMETTESEHIETMTRSTQGTSETEDVSQQMPKNVMPKLLPYLLVFFVLLAAYVTVLIYKKNQKSNSK